MFLSRLLVKNKYCGEPSLPVVIHLTTLRRFAWSSLACMCSDCAQRWPKSIIRAMGLFLIQPRTEIDTSV